MYRLALFFCLILALLIPKVSAQTFSCAERCRYRLSNFGTLDQQCGACNTDYGCYPRANTSPLVCDQCDGSAGYIADLTSSTGCRKCATGSDIKSTQYPAGQYGGKVINSCNCPAGSGEFDGACKTCASQGRTTSTFTGYCGPCDASRGYISETGSTCQQCSANQLIVTSSNGVKSCATCPLNSNIIRNSNGVITSCSCSGGRALNQAGSECIICSSNQIITNERCTDCVAGSRPAIGRTNCICDIFTRQYIPQLICEDCPTGAFQFYDPELQRTTCSCRRGPYDRFSNVCQTICDESQVYVRPDGPTPATCRCAYGYGLDPLAGPNDPKCRQCGENAEVSNGVCVCQRSLGFAGDGFSCVKCEDGEVAYFPPTSPSASVCGACPRGSVPNSSRTGCACIPYSQNVNNEFCRCRFGEIVNNVCPSSNNCGTGRVYNVVAEACCPVGAIVVDNVCQCDGNTVLVEGRCTACSSPLVPNAARTSCVCPQATPLQVGSGSNVQCLSCPSGSVFIPASNSCDCGAGKIYNSVTNTCDIISGTLLSRHKRDVRQDILSLKVSSNLWMSSFTKRFTRFCSAGQIACSTGYLNAFECIDPLTSLELCGGCADSPASIDCTSLARSARCISGKCHLEQ